MRNILKLQYLGFYIVDNKLLVDISRILHPGHCTIDYLQFTIKKESHSLDLKHLDN